MTQIASLNQQLQGLSATDPAAATLMDQRDSAINDLSTLMDVNVVYRYGQPGQRLHNFGHAARQRLPRVHDQFLFAGVADGEFAVQHQPQPKRRRIAHDPASERRQLRHGRQQYDHLGQDRGRPEIARPDPGAGPDPGRSARGLDVERPVGYNDGRHRRHRTAVRLQRQYVECAGRQHHQPDRYHRRRPAPSSRYRSSTSPIRPRCRCRTAERQSKAYRRRFVRRHNADRAGATESGARPQRHVLGLRHHAECRIGCCGGQCRFDHDDDVIADERQPQLAVVHRRHFALYRRDHVLPARR